MWKNTLKLLIISGFGLWLTACTPPRIEMVDSTTITFERTACYGECPAYKVTIYADGRVNYEGYGHVDIEGTQTTVINPSKVHALLYEFGKIDFFSLEDRYAQSITDIPTFTITLKIGNKQKHVEHYGCLPQILIDLEYLIDETVGSEQWVGQNAYQLYPKPTCADYFPEQPISPLK